MQKLTLLLLVLSCFAFDLNAQTQFKVVTVVESIVPAGLGRSRIIESQENVSVDDVTTVRTDGRTSDMKEVKRKDLKIDNFDESKLLNFYSLGGINFQNIASNDALISDKLTKMAEDGWQLMFVTSGVESNAGGQDGEGIFVTRFIFKK